MGARVCVAVAELPATLASRSRERGVAGDELMTGAARTWFRWGLGLTVLLCAACDRADTSTPEGATAVASRPKPAASPAGSGVEAPPAAEAEAKEERDVRWLLRPPLRGAPLGASTAKAKEVPIPHAPGSPVAQALPLVGAESRSQGSSAEVPLTGRANSLRAFPQNVADKPVPRVGAEPWQISDQWLSEHERQLHAPRRADAKVVFLGDSITAGWRSAPAYRSSFSKYTPLNLGIAGDHTQNVLWRLEQGALEGLSPQVVVVMIGVNNLGGGFTPSATVGGVRAVVSSVQERLPRSHVLLLGILPARRSPSEGLRSKIAESNRLLGAIGWSSLTSFRDVGSVFLDPEGNISKAIMRDFLHPTAEGYQLLSDSVEPLLSQLLGT